MPALVQSSKSRISLTKPSCALIQGRPGHVQCEGWEKCGINLSTLQIL
jgi:hypothetical protein